MEDSTQEDINPVNNNYINLRLKRPRPAIIKTTLMVIIIAIILFFSKGLFIAASVDGAFISRRAVIKELEKQGGKQVLEEMIKNKLAEIKLAETKITIPKEVVDKEIENIRIEIASQGGTLEAILEEQGETEEKLREQIADQKRLEQILSNKIAVTDEEVDTYLANPQVKKPEGTKMADFRKQVKEGLGQQKFQQASQEWISNIATNAKIKYYVNY